MSILAIELSKSILVIHMSKSILARHCQNPYWPSTIHSSFSFLWWYFKKSLEDTASIEKQKGATQSGSQPTLSSLTEIVLEMLSTLNIEDELQQRGKRFATYNVVLTLYRR